MSLQIKTCRRCLTPKPVSEFYPQSMGRGGWRSYCKACNRVASSEWASKNIDRARTANTAKMKRWRLAHPERWREICRKAAIKFRALHPDSFKRHRIENDRRQKARHPERLAAKQAVLIATRCGKLVRMPCEVCGEAKTHGHHDDYSKPLTVRWLCPSHHREHHASINRNRSL